MIGTFSDAKCIEAVVRSFFWKNKSKDKDNSFNIKYFCGEVNLEYFLAEGIFV